jgi:hypothetical protein
MIDILKSYSVISWGTKIPSGWQMTVTVTAGSKAYRLGIGPRAGGPTVTRARARLTRAVTRSESASGW